MQISVMDPTTVDHTGHVDTGIQIDRGIAHHVTNDLVQALLNLVLLSAEFYFNV